MKALIDTILANAKGYYVNVHNASYPAGTVRGQLRKRAPTSYELVPGRQGGLGEIDARTCGPGIPGPERGMPRP